MISYGGSVEPVSFPISLTRDGIPRLIPVYDRRVIRRRSDESDALVKFYLSMFSVTCVIPLAKKLTRGILSTITTPLSPDVEVTLEKAAEEFRIMSRRLLHRYIPSL